MIESFEYSSYANLLTTLMRTNANVCFGDFFPEPPEGRYFISRHDLDMSLETGLRMAEFEHELGVRATYFFLFSSPFYNLLSEGSFAYPRKFIELGHEVGLHYDVSCYAALSSDPAALLRSEMTMLGRLSGRPVRSISMHNPSINGADPFRDMPGVQNAYADAHTTEIAYWSDSAGAWRDKTVQAVEQGAFPPRLQLLSHPVFWNDHPGDRWSRLEDLLVAQAETLRSVAALSRKAWHQHTGVLEHDRRVQGRGGHVQLVDGPCDVPTPPSP